MKYIKLGISALIAQNIYSNCYKSTKAPSVDEIVNILKLDKNDITSSEEININEKQDKFNKATEKDLEEYYNLKSQAPKHSYILAIRGRSKGLFIIYKNKITKTNTGSLEELSGLSDDEMYDKIISGGILFNIWNWKYTSRGWETEQGNYITK